MKIVSELGPVGLARHWLLTFRMARLGLETSPSWLERQRIRARALGPLRRPVFVLGCPRSGTTFLGEVLQALPGTSYYFEPPILKYYSRLVHEGRVSPRQARRFYRRALRMLLLWAPGRGPRIIEKNPTHTFIAEALHACFPDALFVVIRRDGRDTALSLLAKPWHRKDSANSGLREPGGYLYGPYAHFYVEPERRQEFEATTDLHRCIWIWRRYTEEVERLESALPSEVQLHLRYEELIRRPEESLDRLLGFLGEDTAEARRRTAAVLAGGHERSIGRWRQRLDEADARVVEGEAGALLERLGYADGPAA